MDLSQITYINLDTKAKRKSLMEDQLSRQKIPYFRTPGVVCEDFLSREVDESISFGSGKHKGTVGCFLAHRNAVKSLLDGGGKDEDLVMILEDDVLFGEEFWAFLERSEFHTRADIMFFNASFQYKSKPKPPPNEKNLYEITGGYPMFLGAFAYVMKFKMLGAILEQMDSVDKYDDVDCGFYYKRFSCYTLVTETLRMNNFKSDRDPEGHYNKDRKNG